MCFFNIYLLNSTYFLEPKWLKCEQTIKKQTLPSHRSVLHTQDQLFSHNPSRYLEKPVSNCWCYNQIQLKWQICTMSHHFYDSVPVYRHVLHNFQDQDWYSLDLFFLITFCIVLTLRAPKNIRIIQCEWRKLIVWFKCPELTDKLYNVGYLNPLNDVKGHAHLLRYTTRGVDETSSQDRVGL